MNLSTLKLRQPLTAIFAIAMVTSLSACQTVSPGWRDDVRGNIDSSIEQAKTPPGRVPADVNQAMLPPLEITVPNGKVRPLEPRFDLSVDNAPARQVFMGLVDGTPYSMVVQPDVQGAISIHLKDVTVPEAMQAIRQGFGYEYRREGNRFFVLGGDIQTRLFSANYLNLVRKGKSDTRVNSGGIGQRSSSGGTSTAASSSGNPGFSSIDLETQSQSDFWKDLSETLKAMIGTEGGRKVVVNPQTGVIAVRAYPRELRLVEEYLGATHATVNRQVVLEAKILDVELNDRFQAGINWAKVHGDYTFAQVGGGSGNLPTGGSTPFTSVNGTLLPGSTGALQSSATLTSAFGGVFTLTAVGNNFTALVELLKAQGEVQVLSSPRVSTVNNQKAVIKVGGDEFFVTGVTTQAQTTTTGVTTETAPKVELTSFFSGIVLDVTPQIDENNNIVLHIHPSVSNVSQKSKTFTVSGRAFDLPLAFSTIQESDNIVRASSGQIIVIGGLMKEGSTDEDASVPLLGDIPVLGNLFKHKRVTRIKKELVILLRPTVVSGAEDWNNAVDDAHERVKKLRLGS